MLPPQRMVDKLKELVQVRLVAHQQAEGRRDEATMGHENRVRQAGPKENWGKVPFP